MLPIRRLQPYRCKDGEIPYSMNIIMSADAMASMVLYHTEIHQPSTDSILGVVRYTAKVACNSPRCTLTLHQGHHYLRAMCSCLGVHLVQGRSGIESIQPRQES
jgi:hypothetical protein